LQEEQAELLEVLRESKFEIPSSRRVRIYALPKIEAVRFTTMSLFDFARRLLEQIRSEQGHVIGYRHNPELDFYEFLCESLHWEYVALPREEDDPFVDVPVFPLRVRPETGQVQQ
jgi:hypothetical protein